MVDVDPNTYWTFLEILTQTPCATTYQYRTVELHKGEPRVIRAVLSGDKFDLLPWDGQDGDIVDAVWTPPSVSVFSRDQQVAVGLGRRGGIYVVNPYGEHRLCVVSRGDAALDNPSSDPGLRNRGAMYRYAVNTDEEMVAKVLELIVAGNWQDFVRSASECIYTLN